ncbi:nicotinate-nucleotide--dimethylbenzimidazole phosphoribosyltransferase [Streptomyces sp. NPDC014805]|uniref:nicotinate-nucleotide--dimethylbenzimidazole phosphoribosyltransferase n=1 Tax=Streptomyces sp. NPDC014805 TaxID=3364919 RepID=UPI0036F97EA3
MTDTGQVPGEGLPENAGTVEQPGASAPGAYAYLSETTAEDEDLLLPGSHGAWGNEVAPPAPEPVVEAVHEPGPHELSGRDSGSVDLNGVRLPGPAPRRTAPTRPIPPITPRRPLHLGPPTPDTSASPVRSLADRGPADAPVRQPAPATAGPEYLDVAQQAAPAPQAAAPWAAQAQVAPGASPAETVVPAAAPQPGPVDAAQAAVARLTTQAAATAPGAPAVPEAQPVAEPQVEAVAQDEAAAAPAPAPEQVPGGGEPAPVEPGAVEQGAVELGQQSVGGAEAGPEQVASAAGAAAEAQAEPVAEAGQAEQAAAPEAEGVPVEQAGAAEAAAATAPETAQSDAPETAPTETPETAPGQPAESEGGAAEAAQPVGDATEQPAEPVAAQAEAADTAAEPAPVAADAVPVAADAAQSAEAAQPAEPAATEAAQPVPAPADAAAAGVAQASEAAAPEAPQPSELPAEAPSADAAVAETAQTPEQPSAEAQAADAPEAQENGEVPPAAAAPEAPATPETAAAATAEAQLPAAVPQAEAPAAPEAGEPAAASAALAPEAPEAPEPAAQAPQEPQPQPAAEPPVAEQPTADQPAAEQPAAEALAHEADAPETVAPEAVAPEAPQPPAPVAPDEPQPAQPLAAEAPLPAEAPALAQAPEPAQQQDPASATPAQAPAPAPAQAPEPAPAPAQAPEPAPAQAPEPAPAPAQAPAPVASAHPADAPVAGLGTVQAAAPQDASAAVHPPVAAAAAQEAPLSTPDEAAQPAQAAAPAEAAPVAAPHADPAPAPAPAVAPQQPAPAAPPVQGPQVPQDAVHAAPLAAVDAPVPAPGGPAAEELAAPAAQPAPSETATPLPGTVAAAPQPGQPIGQFVPVEGSVPTTPHLAPTPPHPLTLPAEEAPAAAQPQAVAPVPAPREAEADPGVVQHADDLRTRAADQEDQEDGQTPGLPQAAPVPQAQPAPQVPLGAEIPHPQLPQDARLPQDAQLPQDIRLPQDPQTPQDPHEEGDAAVAEAPESTGPAAPGYDEAEREAVLKVMRERRDIRNGFRKDPIPHEVLLRVLEAAHHAPSVGHSQPWDFVVIRSADTRRAMHELATRQREAYAKSLPKGRAKQFKELKIEAILDTPVNIVVTADPTRGGRHTLGRHTQPQMAPYSAALAVENLWLAARAEGLGVGWVSFFDEREMVRALGLPEHLEVIAYLCVGYVDEFPDEPELMQAGWSKRRPLSWVVHEETYGRRALPGEEPHDLLAETVAQIRPLDAKALGEAWERQKRMTKPAGALGMLEIISAQLCGLSRQCPPPIPEPAAVAIFAGDHGVHAQGVTPWPQEVTGQMVANFLGGGAVCNAFASQVGAEVCVVDVGVAADLPATPGLLPRKIRGGTSDMTTGPAMTREEAKKAIEVGIETARDLVAAGNKALLTGEMGIANTTASAALISVFTGAEPAEVTGRGTGINDETLARKTDVVRRALELHQPDPADPIGVLAAVGGFEHAAMVGLLLGGASLRTPVILDGVSAGAAALVARAIAPEVLAACIAGHRSAEPGHVAALNKLGLRPLVDLDLRLGEGTGALLALPLVQSTARAMHEVATFDSAGVTEK